MLKDQVKDADSFRLGQTNSMENAKHLTTNDDVFYRTSSPWNRNLVTTHHFSFYALLHAHLLVYINFI